jgi:hypothetical protein
MALLVEAYEITDQTDLKNISTIDKNICTAPIVGTITATTDPNKPTIFPNYAAYIYSFDNGLLYIKDHTWFGYYEIGKCVKTGDIIKTTRDVYGIISLNDTYKNGRTTYIST